MIHAKFLFWLRADCKYILDDYLSAINDCDKSIEINSENSYFILELSVNMN